MRTSVRSGGPPRLLAYRAASASLHQRRPRPPVAVGLPIARGTSYVVCTNPRSGSWLLCDGLASTTVAGNPREWFNILVQQIYRARWRMVYSSDLSHVEYLKIALAESATGNGVSGSKLHYYQLAALPQTIGAPSLTAAGALETMFPRAGYIWLTRENKTEQAISFLVASSTREWWRIGGLARPRQCAAVEPEFDRCAIARIERDLHHADRQWQAYFSANRITPLTVRYEDLAADYDATIRRVLRWLGVAHADAVPIAPPRLERQANARSEAWLARYERLESEQSSRPDAAEDRSPSLLAERIRESRSAVPDAWRQWVAQSMLLGASEQEIVDVLVSNGYPSATAVAEIQAAAANAYMQGALSAQRRVRQTAAQLGGSA
jgi:trehalose 2-sulfotransferase